MNSTIEYVILEGGKLSMKGPIVILVVVLFSLPFCVLIEGREGAAPAIAEATLFLFLFGFFGLICMLIVSKVLMNRYLEKHGVRTPAVVTHLSVHYSCGYMGDGDFDSDDMGVRAHGYNPVLKQEQDFYGLVEWIDESLEGDTLTVYIDPEHGKKYRMDIEYFRKCPNYRPLQNRP